MAQILIRVGASLDRSTATVFTQLSDLARRAGKAAESQARESGAVQTKIARSRLTEEEKAYKASEQAAKKAAKEQTKAAEAAAREAQSSFEKGERAKTREMEKEVRRRAAISRQEAKDAEDIAKKVAKAQMEAGNARSAHYASMRSGAIGLAGRAAMGVGRMGLSILGDIAAGAGVNLDAGSHFANASALNEMTTNLSNQGYMPGQQGMNGTRVDPRELQNQAYEIGSSTGTSANDVAEAMSVMVGKTGDLQATRDTMADLAKLSKASGTSLKDMADAAGDVSNQLGDIPDKGKVVNEVMRAIAGQGKLGAVEIKDLASQMAKVASGAQQIEGNAAENIKLLGAFAQEARQRGGAASASQAATSVQGLINTFKTPARMAEFKANGIDVTNKEGMIRNPEEIVIQALQKKGTDVAGFKKMFANVQGARAVEGFASIYRQTYAHTSGNEQEKMAAATKAVREEFDRLKNVAMGSIELQESFNRAMGTGQAQAATFNNAMQKLAGEVQNAVLPALIALTPALIAAATDLGDFIAQLMGKDKTTADKSAGATAADDADQAAIKGVLNNPNATEEDYSKANAILEKHNAEIKVAANAQQKDVWQNQDKIAASKKAGYGDAASNAIDELKHGNNPFTPNALHGNNRRKRLTAEAEKGAAALAEDQAHLRRNEEQSNALKDMHDFFKHGTIKVQVVNQPSPNGSGPPGAAPPQNAGLAPNE